MFHSVSIKSQCGIELRSIQVRTSSADPTNAELIGLVKTAMLAPGYSAMLRDMGLAVAVRGGTLGVSQIVDAQTHRVLGPWCVTRRIVQDSSPWANEVPGIV